MSKTKKVKIASEPTEPGFTIIEVSLVTAFMAMLLIAIAVITTSIAALYQKGITLKTVNSVGRNLITELTTSINSAPSIDSVSLCNTLLSNSTATEACLQDNAYKYIYYSLEGTTENPDTHADEPVQYGGILCTGNYSYVWNTHYGLETGSPSLSLTYQYPNPDIANNYLENTIGDFKLIRFRDRTYRACSTIRDTSNYNKVSDTFNETHNINITELANGSSNSTSEIQDNFLEASDLELFLYELTIFPVSQDSVTLRSFFSGTFILATERGGVNIIRTGDYCSVGEDADDEDDSSNIFSLGSEFNYCGINKFNFAARTAGSGV